MEEALLSHLVQQAPLASLVYDRVQWSVRDAVAPCVALHLIDAPPDWHLQGPSGLVMARVQADCWDLTFLGSKAVATALKASLPANGQVTGGVRFDSCVILGEDRAPFGEAPNVLLRSRIDVRVTFVPAI